MQMLQIHRVIDSGRLWGVQVVGLQKFLPLGVGHGLAWLGMAPSEQKLVE